MKTGKIVGNLEQVNDASLNLRMKNKCRKSNIDRKRRVGGCSIGAEGGVLTFREGLPRSLETSPFRSQERKESEIRELKGKYKPKQ